VEQTVSANNYPRTRPREAHHADTQNSAKQTPRPVLFNAHINAAPSFLGAQHHVVDVRVVYGLFRFSVKCLAKHARP